MRSIKETKIAIIGVGYVGLPLAIEFGKKMNTVGFDVNEKRIDQLKKGVDVSGEISKKEISQAKKLSFTASADDLKKSNFFIIAVPTPVTESRYPDFDPLIKASEFLGKILKKNDVVVYESTVYPGATEEICVPILEQESGLAFNKDFFVGYSPERISPADKNKVSDIAKVTSGSTPKTGKYIDNVYRQIIKAGTFLVDDMKIAEACKVMENIQRDVNIALMNEISILLQKMDIDTHDVIAAMRTKWNALPFVPGLVGGHCIGVDPYYLIFKSQEVGCSVELIRNARLINDGMPQFIANQAIAAMCKKSINPVGGKALILGATFKENCSDIRNSRSFDIVTELKKYGLAVDIHDPVADHEKVQREYGFELVDKPENGVYDVVLLAVAHKKFKDAGVAALKKFGKKKKSVFFDIKSVFKKSDSDLRL
jgi:UDP-N-acetyl-D-galactosamine dehydrogenase